VPHGILRVFTTILYENEFQNPQTTDHQSFSRAFNFKTRLKRLPVISRQHFRKTRTIYFYKHLLGISNINLQNGNGKAIGISNTDWYFGCRLVLRVLRYIFILVIDQKLP
jgi:hypothetical protein